MAGGWITINGTHVMVDGGGKVVVGPGSLRSGGGSGSSRKATVKLNGKDVDVSGTHKVGSFPGGRAACASAIKQSGVGSTLKYKDGSIDVVATKTKSDEWHGACSGLYNTSFVVNNAGMANKIGCLKNDDTFEFELA